MSTFRATAGSPAFRRLAQSRPAIEATTEQAAWSPAANFTSLESLVGLRWHDGPDIRPILLRVLTDLYVQKPSHSPDEEQQYVELAVRLIDAVDLSMRRDIRERLAAYPGAPETVLHRLAADTTALPDSGASASPIVPHNVAPVSIRASDATADAFAVIASELNEIFFAAAPAERRLIAINLDYSTSPPAPPMATASANETNAALEMAALQGRREEFIRALERAMRVARLHAQRIVNDPSGEPLVVAARALDMPIDMLQRVLLCVNPAIGHTIRRIYHLTALYKEMCQESALRLVAIWRAASPAAQAAAEHQPISRDDEARGARELAGGHWHASPRGAIRQLPKKLRGSP
jgi:hypothetical protein